VTGLVLDTGGLVRRRKPVEGAPGATVRDALDELRRSADPEEAPALVLKELVRRFRDPGAALAEILARDADEALSEYALMMLFLAAQDPGVPARTKALIGASAVPVLLAAMRDDSVPDERKFNVGPALHLLGGALSDEEYRGFFRDFEGTAKEMKRRKLSTVVLDTAAVEQTLVAQELIKHEAPAHPSEKDFALSVGMGLEMCEASPDAGAAIVTTAVAIAIEHGVIGDEPPAVLDRLGDMRTRRAAWFLRELGALPGSRSAGVRARDLARELETAGVEPGAPPTGEFAFGHLSSVDGSGSRTLMLFFRTGDGGLDALALLLNDFVGLKDVWCVFGNAADLDEEVQSRAGDEVSYAHCGVDFAREVVADALAVHEGSGRPFPGRFLLYRHYLGPAPLAPARRAPNLGAYATETFVRGPQLVEGTEAAFEDPIYGGLWTASGEAFDFMRGYVPKKKGRGRAAPLSVPREAFDDFVAKVASKEKQILARRLAVNLEVEALAGRSSKPASRAAARVWIALTEDVVPFEKIPLVRLLCKRATRAIAASLLKGYGSQEEANRAAIDRDMKEMDDEMGEIGGKW
jgi:hypothetical protein